MRPIKGQHFQIRCKGTFRCSPHDPLLPTLHSFYFSVPEFEKHNTAKFDSLFWSPYCQKYSPVPFGSTVMVRNPVFSILQNEATIKDTQLGSNCSGTCQSPFQCCFVMVFGRIVQVRAQHWKEEGKGRRAQLVDVIPSINPSSNVTNCRKVVDFAFFWEYKNHWTNSHFYKGH